MDFFSKDSQLNDLFKLHDRFSHSFDNNIHKENLKHEFEKKFNPEVNLYLNFQNNHFHNLFIDIINSDDKDQIFINSPPFDIYNKINKIHNIHKVSSQPNSPMSDLANFQFPLEISPPWRNNNDMEQLSDRNSTILTTNISETSKVHDNSINRKLFAWFEDEDEDIKKFCSFKQIHPLNFNNNSLTDFNVLKNPNKSEIKNECQVEPLGSILTLTSNNENNVQSSIKSESPHFKSNIFKNFSHHPLNHHHHHHHHHHRRHNHNATKTDLCNKNQLKSISNNECSKNSHHNTYLYDKQVSSKNDDEDKNGKRLKVKSPKREKLKNNGSWQRIPFDKDQNKSHLAKEDNPKTDDDDSSSLNVIFNELSETFSTDININSPVHQRQKVNQLDFSFENLTINHSSRLASVSTTNLYSSDKVPIYDSRRSGLDEEEGSQRMIFGNGKVVDEEKEKKENEELKDEINSTETLREKYKSFRLNYYYHHNNHYNRHSHNHFYTRNNNDYFSYDDIESLNNLEIINVFERVTNWLSNLHNKQDSLHSNSYHGTGHFFSDFSKDHKYNHDDQSDNDFEVDDYYLEPRFPRNKSISTNES